MSREDDMKNCGVQPASPEGDSPDDKAGPPAEAKNTDVSAQGAKKKPKTAAEEEAQAEREAAEHKKDRKRNKKMMSTGANAAGAAVKVGMFMKSVMMLKMLLAWMMGLASAVASAISSFITTVINFVVHCVQAVAFALGVSVLACAVGTGFLFAGAVVCGIVAYVTNSDEEEAQRDDKPRGMSCLEQMEAQSAAVSGEAVGDMQTETNAKLVYSVLKSYGMDNVNIAGVLGNWTHESGIDPTSVETIYTEPFVLGARKIDAMQHGFSIRYMAPKYSAKYPKIVHAGIGLGQWTDTTDGSERHTRLLNFASAAGQNWYSLDIQLAFMLAPKESGGDTRSDWFAKWETEDNPYNAAKTFNEGWEGIKFAEKRGKTAEEWFAKMALWEYDKAYGDSIIAMAGNVQSLGVNIPFAAAGRNCRSAKKVDNSTLADAAVAYAYESTEEGKGNNGTPLYQRVHEEIFPGDGYFMSCDRTVACAVRWSGTDDAYPPGACIRQLEYLKTSDKWEEVTGWDHTVNTLQPGDVLIRADGEGGVVDHTVLYVGNAAIRKKFPNADPSKCIVSGSINSRSPGCGGWYADLGSDEYHCFRNIKKEANSKYKDVAAGMSY